MHFQHEIPDFLVTKIAYGEYFTQRRGNWRDRSCIILTRSLKMYEFRQKELLYSIDLNGTCLAKIKQDIVEYNGPQCKWQSDYGAFAIETLSLRISFGKFECQHLYLLLQCGNLLLVLRRPRNDGSFDSTTYELISEFENVVSYRLIRSTKIKYQAMIELHFTNGGKRVFNDFNTTNRDKTTDANFHLENARIRATQSELQVHCSNTQCEFQRLRNMYAFGSNIWRTGQVEEKQLLARCGDIWLRLTTNDQVVIGIPLVNNTSPPNLSVLRNIRPILRFSEQYQVASSEYQYQLYQLREKFEDLESVKTFLNCDHHDCSDKFPATEWHPCDNPNLQPETFAVLIIQMPISQVQMIDRCSLNLYFEVERPERPSASGDQKSISCGHQILLNSTLDFANILSIRNTFQVSFQSRSSLHQDFLTIAITSCKKSLTLKFTTVESIHEFRKALVTVCLFTVLHDSDETDEEQELLNKSLGQRLFYNHNPASLWYGCLIIERSAQDTQQTSTTLENSTEMEIGNGTVLNTKWIFYAPTEEKISLLVRLLFKELLLLSCNVSECFSGFESTAQYNYIAFADSLRNELQKSIEMMEIKSHSIQDLKDLTTLQLQTDCAAAILRDLSST